MAQDANPEVKAAIAKGATAEAVLLAIGCIVFVFTGQVAWLLGAGVIGGAIMVLLLAQAGAFKGGA